MNHQDGIEYPEVKSMFGPQQTGLQDIPMLLFDISKATTALPESNAARLSRACAIASALIRQGIPVLPHSNPYTNISHHRIRLSCAEAPERMVELFVRDTDLYLVGFRRCLVINGVEHWGELFVFGDLLKGVPAFLHPVKIGVLSSHSKMGGFPGPAGMVAIFQTLAGFQDKVEIVTDKNGNRKVKELRGGLLDSLRIAMTGAILVFCESLRFRSVCHETLENLQGNGNPYFNEVSQKMWDLIHSWGTFSKEASNRRKRKIAHRLMDALPQKDQYTDQGLTILDDLIGAEGELKVCGLHMDYIITPAKLKKLENVHSATHVVDPGFIQEGEGGEAQGGGRGRGRGRGRGGP